MPISLISTRYDVEPYVVQIREAADSEKDAFGFLPASAYADLAYQNRIVVAVETTTHELMGYIVFGGILPQGRIFQTWSDPKFRGQGVGRTLVQEVIRRLEYAHFLSIKAEVADDLRIANLFYGDLGFDVIRTRPGGKSRGRTINVRVRELATPSLLDLAIDRSELMRLPIGLPTNGRPPLYVIDLNVLFDVTKQRIRSKAASRVMSAAFENDVRLSVSAELIEELERHTVPGEPDPVLALAKTLPRLPAPTRSHFDRYVGELAPIVFPDRSRAKKLKIQDYSDLKHLVTAISECATGFITSENAIIKSAVYFRQNYGLDILSPETFAPEHEPNAAYRLTAMAGSSHVVSRTMSEGDASLVEEFLQQSHVAPSEIRTILSSGTATLPRRRILLWVDGCMRGVGSWDAASLATGARELRIYVDEAHLSSVVCAQHLLSQAIADVGALGPAILQLAPRAGQSTLRRIAFNNGFFSVGGASPRTQILRKVALGQALTPDNWSESCKNIRSRSGMHFPAKPPEFTGIGQPLEITDGSGTPSALALGELERLLSPALIILPERPSVVLPITQQYAEELFRGSSQPTLLTDREAVLHAVRGYISKAGTYSVIKDGSIAVFYESGTGGGRSAATAIARVNRRYLMEKSNAAAYSVQKGVLEGTVIQAIDRGGQVTVIEFDNLMLFRRPVPLAKLRAIGCVDGTNFVTARSLAPEHLLAIVKAGEPHA